MSAVICSSLRDYCCCAFCCPCWKTAFDVGEGEAEDDDAKHLSPVGMAAYDVLRKKHWWFHHRLWNVTSGKFCSLDLTPRQALSDESVEDGHSDWLPEKMGSLIALTEVWCDVTSLGPPDGAFLEHIRSALKALHEKDKPITVRMLFGNVVGMPVNCDALMEKFTVDVVPQDTKLRLWVGAWRKAVSWNHSKIIAVDGQVLHTGGHNMWDPHYLKFDPVFDLGVQLEGRVAHDGHLYANDQWLFIEVMQRTWIGYFIDKIPDMLDLPLKTRVTVTEFPKGVAPVFPPRYYKALVPRVLMGRNVRQVPMITMGRLGKITPLNIRPSDDAIFAMLGAATKIIRLSLQDMGPVCIPTTKVALPGCTWPHAYLKALARVIWKKGVDVEVVVSNPGSIPGGLKMTEACYGNGWTCVDVAAEIIKSIKCQFPKAKDEELRQKVQKNLRVCLMRGKRGNKWEDGMTVGLHTKHFIVDDVCCYIGSQNLYVCDLAEWGVVIDDAEVTKTIMDGFWNPLWEASYQPEDCDVEAVMNGLVINRDGEDPNHISEETKELMEAHNLEKNLIAAGRSGSIAMQRTDVYFSSDDKKEQKKYAADASERSAAEASERSERNENSGARS